MCHTTPATMPEAIQPTPAAIMPFIDIFFTQNTHDNIIRLCSFSAFCS
jgi:hypothetical protein